MSVLHISMPLFVSKHFPIYIKQTRIVVSHDSVLKKYVYMSDRN